MNDNSKRNVILPLPGDPFLFNYWLHFYDNVWGKEIDNLIVVLNSEVELGVVNYIFNKCARRGIKYIYFDRMIDHGEAINRALDYITEGNVMLIEDDAYIFKPVFVGSCFGLLEDGLFDIVGSKRGSCSAEILEAAKRKWGLDYEGYGDQGCNFWPNFFFCNVDLLKMTSRNFGARLWKKGEYIEPLDYAVDVAEVVGDTFVNTSLELRHMVSEERIHYVKQYHAHPDDFNHYQYKTSNFVFEPGAMWTHVGSLSSGISGVLRDDKNRTLARRLIDLPGGDTILPDYCKTEMEKMEWERRVVFWKRFVDFVDVSEVDMFGIRDFYDLYKSAVNRVINQYKLHKDRIDQLTMAYKTLGL